MAHILDEFTALRVMHKRIAAELFNCIRVSLLRERQPWRISMSGIRCMACILDERAWICVDECADNQPILAWTNFQIAQRASLDAPIDCDLYLYHMHAGLIMGSSLDALAESVSAHQKNAHHLELPVSVLKF